MEGTRALLEPGPRGRLLLVLPADEAASSAGMRRSSESIPTTGGLIRTTRVQMFIPNSTVLPLQHVRLSHTRKAQVTLPVFHYSGSPERKVSERKATGAQSFYTLHVHSHTVHFCDTVSCKTDHRNTTRRNVNCCHISTLPLGHPTRNQIRSRESPFRCAHETFVQLLRNEKHRKLIQYSRKHLLFVYNIFLQHRARKRSRRQHSDIPSSGPQIQLTSSCTRNTHKTATAV